VTVSTAFLISTRAAVDPVRPDDVIDLVLALVLASFGAIVVRRGRASGYGWLVLWSGVTLAVVQAAGEAALYGWYAEGDHVAAWVEVAVWWQDQWMLFFAPAVLLLPALFPEGESVGRWRQPVRIASLAWVALIVLQAIADRPAGNRFLDRAGPPANPTGFVPLPVDALNASWLVLTVVSLVIAVGSLRTRWRGADRDQRQQLKWVLFALGVAAVVLIATVVDTVVVEAVGVDIGLGWLEATAVSLSWVAVAVALGFGVLRYRLYDVDLVINRTAVYVVMSALVVVAYAAIVIGVSAAIPALGDPVAAVVAAGVVAVAFAPVRAWVQGEINRLMFGRRDDPYAVLTELGDVLSRSAAPDATFATVADTVATALKLPGVAIELEVDGAWQTRATTGEVGADAEIIPLRYQSTVVGRMVAAPRSPGESLHAADLRLLDNVAHHAAALAHADRLNLALRRSREALVLAREEERRRLRRDLHDGLGPSLASQTFRLDAVLELLGNDPAAAADQIHALKAQNRELVAEIRRLVYELRPPALDELGLAGALAAHGGQLARDGKLTVEVDTDPDPLGDLPAGVEVAAYRIASEAITNVVRHAHATACAVELTLGDRALTVRVRDDGLGVRAVTTAGIGLTSMRERAAELGGTLNISRGRPSGTVVTANLPLLAPVHELEVRHG
jgi:signal transduction histidine kinase